MFRVTDGVGDAASNGAAFWTFAGTIVGAGFLYQLISGGTGERPSKATVETSDDGAAH